MGLKGDASINYPLILLLAGFLSSVVSVSSTGKLNPVYIPKTIQARHSKELVTSHKTDNLVATRLISSFDQVQLASECQCASFLVTTPDWVPEYKVFQTDQHYEVNCSAPLDAELECRRLCGEENTNVARVFRLHPEALTQYPPSPDVPCKILPAPTATFYQLCGRPDWQPLVLPSYTHVCCHPETFLPAWCDAIPQELFEQPPLQGSSDKFQSRGLDLEKSPNDIENNEIESTVPKPSGNVGSDVIQPTGELIPQPSWVRTVLSYLGYSSLSDFIKGIDIMSLPKRFRHAVKTYRDEVHVGQCFMEYTTYSIFTKGENPLDGFFRRSKRDVDIVDETNDHGIEFVQDAENESKGFKSSSTESKQAQIETIKSLVGSLVNMLEQSETTRRYAVVIKQLLPVVTKVYAAEDPQEAVNTLVSTVLGPYFEKIQNLKSKPDSQTSGILKKTDAMKEVSEIPAPPPPPRPNNNMSGSRPGGIDIGSIVINLMRQYMSSYFKTLPGGQERPSVNEIETNEVDNKNPSHQRPSVPLLPGSLLNLINLFMGGPNRPRPPPPTTKATTTSPAKISEKVDNSTAADLVQPKDFVDVILEVIRPVFISILGRAPGDNGVASIREVSRLSVLGRVDDAIAEEVLSPYFCLKIYGVNKAWTLTERTLRTFVKSLSPEEREAFRALFL